MIRLDLDTSNDWDKLAYHIAVQRPFALGVGDDTYFVISKNEEETHIEYIAHIKEILPLIFSRVFNVTLLDKPEPLDIEYLINSDHESDSILPL
jgi:hypothetical protein